MSYPYAAENRLDTPHAYMYAPYGGQEFLAAYVDDRRARVAPYLKGVAYTPQGSLKDMLVTTARGMASVMPPDAFSPAERTPLQPLLSALLGVLAAGDVAAAQPWLARLVQRFEVSKKLYAVYAPGFRKGEGDARDPARYAEVALCLALAHAQSGQLQYLSTLLKLIDLLLSLDFETVRPTCLPEFVALLVAAELEAVCTLAAAQGVYIDVE